METIKIIWLSDSPCCRERVSYEDPEAAADIEKWLKEK